MKKTTTTLLISATLCSGLSFAQEITAPVTAAPTAVTANPMSMDMFIGAALDGRANVIKVAIDSGTDVNMVDQDGRTPLMFAAFNGHTNVVQLLIDAGADLNVQEKTTGSTALMFASSGPYLETVQLLLDSGALINMVDTNEHFSALMWAGAEGQSEVAKLLLKSGADTTLQDVDGDTASSFAEKAGHTELAKLLKPATSE